MAETEAVLLKRFVRSGDAEAFAEIIRLYAGLVYSAALRVLADVDRASDVAQETFLQLAKDAGTVTGSLPGWLHRVATHKAIDQVRRDATRRHREAEYVAVHPHETADWKEISPYVDEGLSLLDPQLRNILISHFLEGRSTRQIARVHGLSQATISRRIEAGVEQLRAGLRRRGILVAAGALGILLGENAVQAMPQVLSSELGKIALISGSLAASTTAGTASGLGAAATSALTVVKTHVVAAAAIVVLGTGSMIVWQQLTKPSGQAPAAPVGSAVQGAAGLAAMGDFDPSGGYAPADGWAQGRWPEMRVDAARAWTGAGTLPAPVVQGLPGAEAETDPRLYVPGREGGIMDGSDSTVAAVPAQPAAEASDRLPAMEGGLYRTVPVMGRGTPNPPADAQVDSAQEAAVKWRRAGPDAVETAVVPAGPVVARADLRFAPPFIGNPGAVLGLQRQNTTTDRPVKMIETPPDAPAEPAYFVVRTGDREIQGITYRSIRSAGQLVLVLDTDGDGLWSDERTHVGRRLRVFSMTATYEFGPVYLRQGAGESGGEAVYAQCSDGKWLNFWPAFYRAGEVLLDGRTYRVSLVDSDLDGRLNESLALPAVEARNPVGDVFAIDLNGDGRFGFDRTGESEIVPLGRPVNVGGQYYSIEVPEDGSTIEFRRAEPVLGQPDRAREQSASDVTSEASTQRWNDGRENPRSSDD